MQSTQKPWMKFVIRFVLPAVIIVGIGISMGALFGFLAVLVFISYMAFQGRAGIYSGIGKLKYARGNIREALKWFEKAYKTGKSSPRVTVSYAYLHLKQGNVDVAEKILAKLLDSKIEHDERMFIKANMALISWKRGDLDGAIAMLEEVNSEIKHTITYGSLGYLKLLKGDLDEALRINLEAYDYNKTNAVIQDNLGQTYYLRGEYDQAAEIYQKLIPSNPTFPEAYFNYGLVLLARDMPVRALEMMKKALNYEFSYLSAVTKEEIETKIKEVEETVKQSD